MRFTTCSAVATSNVFIVSTVALLSLIPAVNAIDFGFWYPEAGDTYQAGEMANVTWYITGANIIEENEMLDVGSRWGLILMEGNRTGYSYLLAKGVALLDGTLLVTYPAAPPSNDYYLSFQTAFGNFTSDIFIIQAAD